VTRKTKPGWKRVVDAIRAHPGATHGDLDELTGLEGITQRVSEARQHGFDIRCERIVDTAGRTRKRYYITKEPQRVTTGEAVPLWDVAS